jgi:hypothetical protein
LSDDLDGKRERRLTETKLIASAKMWQTVDSFAEDLERNAELLEVLSVNTHVSNVDFVHTCTLAPPFQIVRRQ